MPSYPTNQRSEKRNAWLGRFRSELSRALRNAPPHRGLGTRARGVRDSSVFGRVSSAGIHPEVLQTRSRISWVHLTLSPQLGLFPIVSLSRGDEYLLMVIFHTSRGYRIAQSESGYLITTNASTLSASRTTCHTARGMQAASAPLCLVLVKWAP